MLEPGIVDCRFQIRIHSWSPCWPCSLFTVRQYLYLCELPSQGVPNPPAQLQHLRCSSSSHFACIRAILWTLRASLLSTSLRRCMQLTLVLPRQLLLRPFIMMSSTREISTCNRIGFVASKLNCFPSRGSLFSMAQLPRHAYSGATLLQRCGRAWQHRCCQWVGPALALVAMWQDFSEVARVQFKQPLRTCSSMYDEAHCCWRTLCHRFRHILHLMQATRKRCGARCGCARSVQLKSKLWHGMACNKCFIVNDGAYCYAVRFW